MLIEDAPDGPAHVDPTTAPPSIQHRASQRKYCTPWSFSLLPNGLPQSAYTYLIMPQPNARTWCTISIVAILIIPASEGLLIVGLLYLYCCWD